MTKRSGRKTRKAGLRRRVGVRTPRRTLLVFCEGTRTEPDYLHALQQELADRKASAVEIRVDMGTSGAVPLTLVAAASKARSRSRRDQDEIDDVWCLFDVEWPGNHPNLHEAIDRAKRSDVNLAISNPCFELWLVLHFVDRTAWLDNEVAGRLQCDQDGSTGKGLDGTLYMPRRADAARRARLLTAKHERDGTAFPHDNPSSGMYRFLDAIEPNE